MKGFWGRQTSIGTLFTPIPFTKLNLIIEVDFLIIADDVPSLLSKKDMLSNGLEMTIQNKKIYFNGQTQALLMENFFLIHKWSPDEILYALYTGKEISRIHKNFSHPSINRTEGILKRENYGKIDKETEKVLRKIV